MADRSRPASIIAAIREGRAFAVVDLGTTHAKALVLHKGPASLWNVVGASVVPYGRTGRGPEPLLTPAQCQAATEALQQAANRSPSLAGRLVSPTECLVAVPNAHVILSSYRWETNRPHPSKDIDRREQGDLVERARAAALQDAATHLQREFGQASFAWLGFLWCNHSVEGQAVTSLEGFRGKSVAVHLVQAFALTGTTESLSAWAEEEGLRSTLVPEPAWATVLLRKSLPCVLLDGGGLRTDAYIRASDGQFRRLDLPLGGYHINRWLALGAGLSPSRAERIKTAYSARQLRPSSRAKVGAIVQRGFASWAKGLSRRLTQSGVSLPGLWLTSGGHSELPEFEQLPELVAGASMAGLDRYPSLARLTADGLCRKVVPGPERLRPCHHAALGLADRCVSLALDAQASPRMARGSSVAAQAGFTVSVDWLAS
mgnify:CR=1 FL=1